jgi:TonB family protein
MSGRNGTARLLPSGERPFRRRFRRSRIRNTNRNGPGFPGDGRIARRDLNKPGIAAINSCDPIAILIARPEFPERARGRGVEGYVIVQFTVTSAGTTHDVRVIDAVPPNYFEKTALLAAQRFRHQPGIVEGQPADAPGMMYKFVFELED